MLTIEPPIYQVRGVTIFRDHEDPDQFYFLPPVPRLAPQGDGVAFALFKYRRDLTDNPELDPTRAKGGGLALFEVETPVPSAAAIQAELSSLAQRADARLSPVLFRSGTVQAIVAHAEGDRFVQDLVNARAAPLTYPHHAAFALALSAEGATLVEAAARGGQLPVGVAYEFRFPALTPSLHARAHMDYDRIYDHFAVSTGFTYYYVSVRLDLDLEWLIEHDLVKIEIIAFTDGPDRDRQEQLVRDLVKTRIQNDFFTTAVPAEPEQGLAGPLGELVGGLVGSRVTSTSALFVLKAKYEAVKEQKEFDLVFDGRTTVELTHVCTGALATLAADGAPPTIREIDLDDPFFSVLDVQVVSTIDFEEMSDLREAVVHVAHGELRPSYSFSPTVPGPYRFAAALADPRDDEYQYSVEYHFDPQLGGGPTPIEAGPFASRHRVLVIDPLLHFRYLRLRVLLGPVDPAEVPRIRVQLRVLAEPDGPELVRDVVELDHEHGEVVWRQRLPLSAAPLRIRAKSDWEDPSGGVHEGEARDVPGDSFVALGPYRDVLSIMAVPAADWATLSQLRVELRYEDGDLRRDRSLVFTAPAADAPAAEAQTVQFPLLDPAHRAYEWRQVLFRKDGTTGETDWATVDQAILVVGREPPPPGQVRVVWVGSQGAALALRVDFWASDASGAEQNVPALLRAGESETSVTLPLDAQGAVHYRYEVRRITADGDEVVRTGEGASSLLVVQSGE